MYTDNAHKHIHACRDTQVLVNINTQTHTDRHMCATQTHTQP